MKNILLSLLVAVSLIGSANMFAMAEKYEKLFPADKSKLARSLGSEQDFNAAAKKARLDVTWADYQASLAQKGAATGGEAPKGGQGAPAYVGPTYEELLGMAVMEKTDLDVILGLRDKAAKIPGITKEQLAKFDQLWANRQIQQTTAAGEKAVQGLSPFVGGTTEAPPAAPTSKTEPVAPVSPKVQVAPVHTDKEVYEIILKHASNVGDEASAEIFLNYIEGKLSDIRKSLPTIYKK